MAAAIPLVSTGISLVGGLLNKRNQGKQQGQADAASAPGFAAQADTADRLNAQGGAVAQVGQQALGQSTNYYARLLNGDRAAMTGALTPEIGATNAVYAGANRSLDRAPAGAGRDVARAELGRERAGKIGSLVSGVRPMAAEAMTGIGQNALQLGFGARQAAGGIYAQLLQGLNAKRDLDMRQQATNDENNTSLWKNIGQLLVQSYGAYQNRGRAGAGA